MRFFAWMGRTTAKLSRGARDGLAEASAQAQEAFGAYQTVQAFANERPESERYASRVESFFERSVEYGKWQATVEAVMGFSQTAMLVGTVWLGGYVVSADELTAGKLTAVVLYAVLIATDHDNIDYEGLVALGIPILDTRNAIARRGLSTQLVAKA